MSGFESPANSNLSQFFQLEIPNSIDETPRFFDSFLEEERYIEKMAAFYWQVKFGPEEIIKKPNGNFTSTWQIEFNKNVKNRSHNFLAEFRRLASSKIYGIKSTNLQSNQAFNEIQFARDYREFLYSHRLIQNRQLVLADLNPKLVSNLRDILEHDACHDYYPQDTDKLFNTNNEYRQRVIQMARNYKN